MSSYKNINAFDKYGGFRNRGGVGPRPPTADGPPGGPTAGPSAPSMPPMVPPRPARPRLRLPSTFKPVAMPPAVADDGKSSGGRRKRKTHRRKAKKSKKAKKAKKAHKTRRR
jgi:hypothetical protein